MSLLFHNPLVQSVGALSAVSIGTTLFLAKTTPGQHLLDALKPDVGMPFPGYVEPVMSGFQEPSYPATVTVTVTQPPSTSASMKFQPMVGWMSSVLTMT
jgi:hypothetical protein